MDDVTKKMIDTIMGTWTSFMKEGSKFPVMLVYVDESGGVSVSAVDGITPADAKIVLQSIVETLDDLVNNKVSHNNEIKP